jgi:hypothetical protein
MAEEQRVRQRQRDLREVGQRERPGEGKGRADLGAKRGRFAAPRGVRGG